MFDKNSEDPIPSNCSKRTVMMIGMMCGVVVGLFSICLSYFYGKNSSHAVGDVLVSPEKLLQVRVAYISPETGLKEKWFLDKILLRFIEIEDSCYIKRLFPEEYREIFSWIEGDQPLSKSFSEMMVWEETSASIRLYVSSLDQNGEKSKPLVYQEMNFAPDGALFRVSLPVSSIHDELEWVYYHHPGLLKLLRKKFFSR